MITDAGVAAAGLPAVPREREDAEMNPDEGAPLSGLATEERLSGQHTLWGCPRAA
jgi:hypothetical protein